MEKIVYFDYCALLLIIILIISAFSRKMIHGKQNRHFLYLMIMIFITAIADACSIVLGQMGPGYVAAKHISHSIYLITHMVTTPCYVIYLFTVTDVWHRIYSRRRWTILVFLPSVIGIVLMLTNPFTHAMYYLDETDTYTRGDWFIILYAIALFYATWGIIHLCRHRKLFDTIQFVALFSVFPVSIGVAIFQFFFPEYVIEMFANVATLSFVSAMVQRPENLLDADTSLGKLSAYVANVQNAGKTKKPMEIIMLNIVNYDTISDMLGYQKTNSVLKSIANQLVALNKNQHMDAEIYYLGRGKFRIVLDFKHFHMTADIARLICRAMRPGFILDQMTIDLLSHVCIARYPEDIDNIDALIAFGIDLNSQPYTGKVMYASELYKKEYYDIKKDIDIIIEEALAENKFEVYYQPIYSVTEGCFHSAEALLRLKTEKYGFISPELFIPAAEKSGAIHKIGNYVMDEVCKFIASDEYKELGIDYIEVNLSVAQCMQNTLAKDILDTLDLYDVKPNQINLEITETAASYSQQTMMENLQTLGGAGISFSLDDFGTGYSNMRRIASMPFHIIKLDKSYTNIEENPKLLIVVENTIRMIKAMNMQIVVEGIETENMVRQFSDLKCEYIQGYFYSKPLSKRDFIHFIRESVNTPPQKSP